MRLVEYFVVMTATYVKEKPSFERLAETAIILFDAIAKIKGSKISRRPRIGLRKSTVTVGKPISVSDRATVYQQSRQGAKQSVAQLTQDLQTALEEMVF